MSLAKIVPAASQSQPSPTTTRQRGLKQWEILLILCSTATGNCRPGTRFHRVGHYSSVLLLINHSSVFFLLMFLLCLVNSQRGAHPKLPIIRWIRKEQETVKQIVVTMSGSRNLLQKGLQRNPHSPSQHRAEICQNSLFHCPSGLMEMPRVCFCFKDISHPCADTGFTWKTMVL